MSAETDLIANSLRGAAAIVEALALIGGARINDDGDKQMAKIICDRELCIRDLIEFATRELAHQCGRP